MLVKLTTMNATRTATTRTPPIVPKMAPTIEPAPIPLEVELVELDEMAVPVWDAEAEGVKVTKAVAVLLGTVALGV